jgi:hypothetical protein
MIYPYTTPQILTDPIFLTYGGQTGSSTAAQRQAAYVIAEEQMTEHLSTFLVPTIVSGSAWYRGGTLFETEYGNVQRVLLFQAQEVKRLSPLEFRAHEGTALIRSGQFGLVDVVIPCHYPFIYSNTVVYESGFPTGTVPSLLQAGLVLAAQINLNEWVVDLANEGVGDVGIQQFSNQSYSEQRKKLGRNAFGSSALAQRVSVLTKKYNTKPGAVFR